jgi:hypothetical protein
MAKYNEKWDLSTIPEAALKSEWARRNGAKSGPSKIRNDPATEETRRAQREYRRGRRAAGKDLRPK